MSTIAYAQMTNAREAAAPGTSTTTGTPGLKTYVDAFAALVPAEVLTLHALLISFTTETARKTSGTSVARWSPLQRSSPRQRVLSKCRFGCFSSFGRSLRGAPILRWKVDKFDW